MWKWLIIILAILILGFFGLHLLNFKKDKMIMGVSFNAETSWYLGEDPKKVLETIFKDWGFKYVRLTAQWNKIEPEAGKFDFSNLDWQLELAKKYNAKIILAMGQKAPRWPECFSPDWSVKLSDAEYFSALDNYLAKVAEHYQNNPALEVWQVENEPFLAFGEKCRALKKENLSAEILAVKKVDGAHPVLITDSGELSWWRDTAEAGDLFGTTLYRVVWNNYLGYFNYDWLPAAFYRFKLWLNARAPETAWVTELQAEPWLPGNKPDKTNLKEQYKSMDLARLQKNIVYAQKLGLPRAYLWGAEWWYWLKEQGVNDFVDYIKSLEK